MTTYFEIYNKKRYPTIDKLEKEINSSNNFRCQNFDKFIDCFETVRCLEADFNLDITEHLFIVEISFKKNVFKVVKVFWDLNKYKVLL